MVGLGEAAQEAEPPLLLLVKKPLSRKRGLDFDRSPAMDFAGTEEALY
jgi:hypothetical protein